MFVCCDWRRRLWLKKSARVFHVEEPVMRDLGPIDCFRHRAFPAHTQRQPFQLSDTFRKVAARVTQRLAIDIGAMTGRGNPQRKEAQLGSKAPLDAMLVLPIIHLTLMGMGSPDNRRKADGSYQTQGVGRGIFCPSFARERADNGGASCLLDNRNSARGYDVDRWRSRPLLWIWPRTRLVGAFPRHRCRRGGVAYFSKRRRRVNEDRNKPVGWPSC